jgi:hypothetical protein
MLHGAPPRSVPKLVGHLSFGRPRSRDAIHRTFRKNPVPRAPRRSQLRRGARAGHRELLSAIPTTSYCESLNLFQAGSTIQCGILLAGLLLEVRMVPASEARYCRDPFLHCFLNADHSRWEPSALTDCFGSDEAPMAEVMLPPQKGGWSNDQTRPAPSREEQEVR